MANHTPGPWIFVKSGGKGNSYEDHSDMGGFKSDSTADTVCWFGDDTQYYPSEGTPPNEHDARLIAAAPCLLEALIWMVENDDTYEGDEPVDRLGGESWNEHNRYWIEGLNKARAAIAKATGETE